MLPEKIQKLILLLTEKTNNRKALWNKGSSSNLFVLSLAQGAAISVQTWENNWQDHYQVIIFNANGDPIEKITLDQESNADDLNILAAFHKAASNQYYKVDETLDVLLNSVMGQDVIGTTIEDKVEDEDELPF